MIGERRQVLSRGVTQPARLTTGVNLQVHGSGCERRLQVSFRGALAIGTLLLLGGPPSLFTRPSAYALSAIGTYASSVAIRKVTLLQGMSL